jgi:CTP:phosphocholine cytidylyltransferase-like protein/thiamine kinase-like enzyme
LSRAEFAVLDALRMGPCVSQRGLAARLGFSLGKTNGLLKRFTQVGWVAPDGSLSPAGLAALAPYKVDNAVIMAAGMSTRFAPLSYEKPKGLLTVKGEILIERQIRQLHAVGITDITVVVGYMKEQFFYLQEKFGVSLVVNEDYWRWNNVSSLIRVRDRLRNTYICSSDNYFTENVFEPYVYRAYYAAVQFPGPSQEWGLVADRLGRIVGVDHAPVDAWCMMGHAYFDRAFSETFCRLMAEEYDTDLVRLNLWEALLERHLDVLDMHVRRYPREVIREFDSLDDLRAFDDRYVGDSGSAIFGNICSILHCEEREIEAIEVLNKGLTNLSFKFTVRGVPYVYRHPGAGTDAYISRPSEAYSLSVASRLGLDPTLVHIDPATGWKVSRFVENARTLDYRNSGDVAQAARLMRRLHDARVPSSFSADIWDKTLAIVQKTTADYKAFPDYGDLSARMERLHALWAAESPEPFLCHGDCYAPNFLVAPDGAMSLIDWEYSGASDPGVDIGTFVCCSDFTEKEAIAFLALYHGRDLSPAELRHDLGSIALAAWYWFVWAVFQESRGNPVGAYLLLWYNMSKSYLSKALPLHERKEHP